MAKFEITNPDAIKLIASLKTGTFFKPFLDRIRKIKLFLIIICLFLIFLLFYNFGKNLYRRSSNPVFLPPSLDSVRVTAPVKEKSDYDSLRNEIFNFSTDLPDPVMPELNDHINFQSDEL